MIAQGGQYEIPFPDYNSLDIQGLREVERVTRQRLLAVGVPGMPSEPSPPWRAIIAFEEGFLTSDELAEDLLWNAQRISCYCRWITSGSNRGPDANFRNVCEAFIAAIEDGHVGQYGLTQFIEAAERTGQPARACFFLHNVTSVFEDMRSAVLVPSITF